MEQLGDYVGSSLRLTQVGVGGRGGVVVGEAMGRHQALLTTWHLK